MFKKPGKNEPYDPLADRMRKISTVPVEEQTYSSVHEQTGRQTREPTFKQGTVTTRGGERIPVVVKNVSKTGARIEFFRDVTLGDHVLITEPTLRLNIWAEVMWQSRGAAGLKFVPT
jgi:hypothetical protein